MHDTLLERVDTLTATWTEPSAHRARGGGWHRYEVDADQGAVAEAIRYGGCAHPGPLLTPPHPFSEALVIPPRALSYAPI